MKTIVRMRGEITEDGRLLVDLPDSLPRGRVLLTLEPEADDDFDVRDEDLQGLGLTAAEIADAPEIGAWAEDSPAPTGAELVEQVRRAPVR